MNKIERIYRMRRNLLISAFVSSCLLFFFLCFPKPYLSSPRALPWRQLRNPYALTFEIAGILAALLLSFLTIRYFLLRAAALKDPALRLAVDDERIRTGWLWAYRAALYVMAGVHLVYLLLSEGLFYTLGFPHAAWVSSSLGLMTLYGAAIFYTRELKNGHA